MTDVVAHSVFVLDDRRELRHKIPAGGEGELIACAVVHNQLWLGYEGRPMDILSSENIPVRLPHSDDAAEIHVPLSVDSAKFTKTGECKIKKGDELLGLCALDNVLYCVQRREGVIDAELCLYRIQADALTLLSSVNVGGAYMVRSQPAVDRHARYVYVASTTRGVSVFLCENNCLVKAKMLTCVKFAVSVAVKSRDFVYVCDWDTASVMCQRTMSSCNYTRRVQ